MHRDILDKGIEMNRIKTLQDPDGGAHKPNGGLVQNLECRSGMWHIRFVRHPNNSKSTVELVSELECRQGMWHIRFAHPPIRKRPRG